MSQESGLLSTFVAMCVPSRFPRHQCNSGVIYIRRNVEFCKMKVVFGGQLLLVRTRSGASASPIKISSIRLPKTRARSKASGKARVVLSGLNGINGLPGYTRSSASVPGTSRLGTQNF